MDRRQFAKALLGAAWTPLVVRAGAMPLLASSDDAHPVFPPEIAAARAEAIKAGLRTLLELPDSRLLELIPTRTGFIACDCPNCDQGVQGGQLQWRLEEPGVLVCRYCRQSYPTPKYPEDRFLEVKDPLGRMQQYPFYQDASGLKYFFQARGWRLARDFFMLAAYDLAQVYHFTADQACARKAALILDRFAALYPGFIVVRESSQQDQGFQEHPPYDTQGGKWGRWYYDEMPTPLIRAYDLIWNSGALEKLDEQRGAALRRRVEEDFFRGAVRHVRTYPEYYANPSPRIYEGLAVLGRVIGEPDLVHDAARRTQGIFENSFMFDGVWKEGTFGYHDMTMRGLEPVLEALAGYSDPPGYADPTDGTRFDHLNPRQQIPMLPVAQKAMERFCYPDGRPLPVHDSWARLRGTYVKRQPLSSSEPALWPAVGHAYLGRGRGPDQMQVHLHFGGGYGHAHNDSLNLALWAHGEELLPDLGYTHTRYRSWTRSTLAHNTVLVDGHEQQTGSAQQPSDGNLLLFGAAGDVFQVVEASGERSYPERVSAYRRTVMLVGINAHNAYVVDLFRVVGGNRHEWALHGSADRDQRLEVDIPMSPYGPSLLPAGVQFVAPKTEEDSGHAGDQNPAYGFVRDVQRGDALAALVGDFRPAEGEGAWLRVHCLPPAGSQVLAGRAPSIRRADENDAHVEQFWMPMLLLRTEGNNTGDTFAAVLEPFPASSFIRKVEHLPVRGGRGLRILADGWTDYVLYREQEGEAECDQLKLAGRIGWVRERAGQAESMCLIGGTELSFGKQRLTSFGIVTGRVAAVLRAAAGDGVNAFQVAGKFPPADVVGKTVVIRHGDGSTHGYRLAGVQRTGEQTLLILAGEPGFVLRDAKAQFLFFPKREIEGEVTYSIASVAWRKS